MKRLIAAIAMLALVALFPGCAVNVKLNPGMMVRNSDKYTIYLTPTLKDLSGYYTAFDLEIHNKTASDIELVWDKTNFIRNGQTSGGFMYDGIVFADRNNPKQPDVIFPNDKFQKTIWPNNLTVYEKNVGWTHRLIGLGDNGAYLTLRINGEEVKEKMIINMSR